MSFLKRGAITFSNHSRALAGRLYFFAWARISWASAGKIASKSARLVVEAIMTKVGGSKVTERPEVVTIDKLISPAEGPLGVFVVFVLTFAVAPRRLSLLLGIARDLDRYSTGSGLLPKELFVNCSICLETIHRQPIASSTCRLREFVAAEVPVLLEPRLGATLRTKYRWSIAGCNLVALPV